MCDREHRCRWGEEVLSTDLSVWPTPGFALIAPSFLDCLPGRDARRAYIAYDPDPRPAILRSRAALVSPQGATATPTR